MLGRSAVPTVELESELWTPEESEERPEFDDTLHNPAEEDVVDAVSNAAVEMEGGADDDDKKKRGGDDVKIHGEAVQRVFLKQLFCLF